MTNPGTAALHHFTSTSTAMGLYSILLSDSMNQKAETGLEAAAASQ